MTDLTVLSLLLIGASTLLYRCWHSHLLHPIRHDDNDQQGANDADDTLITLAPVFLSTIPPTSGNRWRGIIAITGLIAVGLCLTPFAQVPLPVLPGFVPTIDTLFISLYFIIGYVLLGHLYKLRTYSMLALAFGFFFQATTMAIRVLTFPGLYFDVYQSATIYRASYWFYLLAHIGWPLWIITYSHFHYTRQTIKHIGYAFTISIIALGVIEAIASWVIYFHGAWLPEVISSVTEPTATLHIYTYHLWQSGIDPLIIGFDLIAAIMLLRCGDSMLDIWLLVAMIAATMNMVITGFARHSYDVGFYAGRCFELIAAFTFGFPLLSQMNRLYRNLYSQKQAAEASERTILNAVIDTIIAFDHSGIIRSTNPATSRMFGYSSDEMIGRHVKMLLPESEALTPESIGNGREVTGLRKDGQMIDLDLSMSQTEQHYIGVLRDVTGRKNIERQLLQSQKMETIGQLSGGMAHDFNNILNVVIGNLDLLSDNHPNQPEITEALTAALAGAELVQRLLAFARRQPLAPKLVTLAALINTVLPLLRRTIGTEITIETQLQPDVPPVQVDTVQFQNVIINLAVNARDAMPQGGRLLIGLQEVSIDATSSEFYDVPSGHYAVLSMRDTGVGIPAEILPHVFEPFFTTKEPGSGSGLGLSMVFGYAKQSGGVVRIYSDVGKGTEVRLYLPLTKISEAPHEPVADCECPHDLHGNERILLVEDHVPSRNMAIRVLTDLGYHVLSAPSASVALEYLKNGEIFDLVFTDIIMPEMDGITLVGLVKQYQPAIKIILTSGFSLVPQADITALHAKYIAKPYRIHDLAKLLRQTLDEA